MNPPTLAGPLVSTISWQIRLGELLGSQSGVEHPTFCRPASLRPRGEPTVPRCCPQADRCSGQAASLPLLPRSGCSMHVGLPCPAPWVSLGLEVVGRVSALVRRVNLCVTCKRGLRWLSRGGAGRREVEAGDSSL